MPVFTYTARDGSGNLTKGILEADSNSLAAASLREQGLWVTELRPAAGKSRERRGEAAPPPAAGAPPRPAVESGLGRRLRSPVSERDLALFYRQLYTLLNSGVSLYNALEMTAGPHQSPNAHLRRVAGELSRQVLGGGPMSQAMVRYPWLFDRMQVRMVEAGEAGGLLVEIFRRLSEYLEREFELRNRIKQRTLYPKLVLGLLVLIMPINIPLTLSGYLRDLTHLLLTIAMIAVPAWFGGRLFLTTSAGRDFYDQVKLAIPVTGKVVRKLAAARFARALAALYGAGVPIASALVMAGESCGNHALEMASRRSGPALERGVSIAQTLEVSGFFPPMFIGMVSTGETTGNLDKMLDKAADFYEEEASHATAQFVVVLGVALLIFAAILVLIKVISFYTGMVGGIFNAAGSGGGAVGE